MTQIFEGQLSGQSKARIGIAVSRFNATVTEPLLTGATSTLEKHGVTDIHVAWCPGAFELPVVISELARSGRFDALIALGAVIRGQTYHFEVICDSAVDGLQQVALKTGVPVALGVLTANTVEQAMARSGPGDDNKGVEAALAALEMASLFNNLDNELRQPDASE